jgi:transcriptional regulator with XRE-family HTH domain
MDSAPHRPQHPTHPESTSEPTSDLLATNDHLAISLALLRLVRRWSQSELAAAAGVTNSAISDYERGKVDPQTRTLLRLLEAMGYPLSALEQTREFVLLLRAQLGPGAPAPGERGTSPADPVDHRREVALLAAEGARFMSQFLQLLFQVLQR